MFDTYRLFTCSLCIAMCHYIKFLHVFLLVVYVILCAYMSYAFKILSFHNVQLSIKFCTTHWSPASCRYIKCTLPSVWWLHLCCTNFGIGLTTKLVHTPHTISFCWWHLLCVVLHTYHMHTLPYNWIAPIHHLKTKESCALLKNYSKTTMSHK